MLRLCLTLASEPASILYILTGAVTVAYAGLRKSSKPAYSSSTLMLICRPQSRATLNSLDLL